MHTNSFAETVILLMEATGFDKQTCEELLNEFGEQAVSLITDIQMYVSENNLKEAGRLLHRLKGSSGNVRMKEISKLALDAEKAIHLMDSEMLCSLLQRMGESLENFK